LKVVLIEDKAIEIEILTALVQNLVELLYLWQFMAQFYQLRYILLLNLPIGNEYTSIKFAFIHCL